MKVWIAYAKWFGWVSLAFFPIYPACNWISSIRTRTFGLYLPAELAIPLVPAFVWVYFSMYAIFLLPPFLLDAEAIPRLGRRLVKGTLWAGLVFLVLPTHLGFPRVLPADPAYHRAFLGIFKWDHPHNLVPSLHVVYTTLFLLAYIQDGPRRIPALLWWTWMALVTASTVLVHQHHVLDVVTGLMLAGCLHRAKGEADGG